MSRKFTILVVLCIALFGAILAGYWNMLDTEKLRAVREQASRSMAELTGEGQTPPGEAPTASEALTPSATPGETSSPATPSDPAAPAVNSPALPEGAGNNPSASASVPSFDVLRVEPDGSAVLAGRASPNSEVRLVDGERVLGQTRATAEGAFAIVLDERLASGDHQIRIETQAPDGAASVSAETAIVSVPGRGEPGELLAMVEAPNRPSRLITLPDGQAAALGTPAAAGSFPASNPSGSNDAAASGQGTVAAVQPELPTLPPAAAPLPFAVEAVEIENGTVYISGRAPGQEPVQVYIDDRLVAEDRQRVGGRFLATAKVPLTTGGHRIRVDMIGSDGAVASRVEVPFAKSEGSSMSAIASNDAAANATAAPSSAQTDPSPSSAGNDTAAAGIPADGQSPATTTRPADGDVATVVQPALQGVNARVMIRRGDTLWRISRQTYGQGRRYTVIYLANGDQIRNPNRIYPGQLLRLPNGEEAPAEAVR